MSCSLLTRLLPRRRHPARLGSSPSPAPPLLPPVTSTSTFSPSFTANSPRPNPNQEASLASTSTEVLVLPFTPTLPARSPDAHPEVQTLLLQQEMPGHAFNQLAIYKTAQDQTVNTTDVAAVFQGLEACVGIWSAQPNSSGSDQSCRLDYIVVDFRTHADASQALTLHSHLTVAGQTYPVQPFWGFPEDSVFALNMDASSRDLQSETPTASPEDRHDTPSRPRKRPKKRPVSPTSVACKFCYTELEGPYSTPCRRCQGALCYDCLRKQFEHALSDMEQMPAKCCGMILHCGVVDKLLPSHALEAYRLRFDEHNTPNPLYCPVPRCSTFIPARSIAKGAIKVSCPTCLTAVCTKCKQQAGVTHVCVMKGQREAIIEAFNYKICPKCGTGVMKMYGCPHVRCQCGAHWCWDCQRPMNACYSKPCPVAREASGETDDFEVILSDDSDNDEGPEPAETRPTAQVEEPQTSGEPHINAIDSSELSAQVSPEQAECHQPAPVTSPDSTTIVQTTENLENPPTHPDVGENLDDPDDENIDWEGQSFDFGEEPSDESWDVWGCRHRFREFEKQQIPKFWQVGLDPQSSDDIEVACLSCFEKVKVWATKPDASISNPTASESGTNMIPAKPIGVGDGNISSGKKPSMAKFAFDCQLCGVIYCGACKKAAMKRVKRERYATEDIQTA